MPKLRLRLGPCSSKARAPGSASSGGASRLVSTRQLRRVDVVDRLRIEDEPAWRGLRVQDQALYVTLEQVGIGERDLRSEPIDDQTWQRDESVAATGNPVAGLTGQLAQHLVRYGRLRQPIVAAMGDPGLAASRR
jgi:hypothetical protein